MIIIFLFVSVPKPLRKIRVLFIPAFELFSNLIYNFLFTFWVLIPQVSNFLFAARLKSPDSVLLSPY
ncbi:hypothetical protein D3C71_998200 [compost metagenome]